MGNTVLVGPVWTSQKGEAVSSVVQGNPGVAAEGWAMVSASLRRVSVAVVVCVVDIVLIDTRGKMSKSTKWGGERGKCD